MTGCVCVVLYRDIWMQVGIMEHDALLLILGSSEMQDKIVLKIKLRLFNPPSKNLLLIFSREFNALVIQTGFSKNL